MRCTLFVPDWGATPELHTFAEARRNCPDRASLTGLFRGLPVRYNRAMGCEVIQVNQRLETMPECLEGIRMVSIQMIELTSNLTSLGKVADGAYAEGDIVAHVDTLYLAFMVARSFRVTSGKGATVEEVNAWLDALLTGQKMRMETYALLQAI